MNVPMDLNVQGNLTAQTATLPSACVGDANVKSGADVGYAKLQHVQKYQHYQAPGTAIVAATQDLFIAQAAGSLLDIEAVITGAIATDASRTVTIDLQKSTAGAAFASVLSSTIQLDNTNTIRVLEVGTITTAPFVDGDVFRLTVVVAGGAGNQAQGLLVTVRVYEKPV